MFRLYLSKLKRMRKSATSIGELGDLTVNLRARSGGRQDLGLREFGDLKVNLHARSGDRRNQRPVRSYHLNKHF